MARERQARPTKPGPDEAPGPAADLGTAPGRTASAEPEAAEREAERAPERLGGSHALVNVLLVGGGAREHALAWRLRQSPRLGKLWLTDGENPGLAALGQVVDVPVDWVRPYRIQSFCEKNRIGLVVIGPEDPLAAGAADALATPGRVVFGPGKEAAQLESDKAWCRMLLRGASVPMPEGRVFADPEAAKGFLQSRESPHVVKAAGLARGKGVFVPDTLAEAPEAVDRIMVRREFGEAGRQVIVEERLKGREASVLALVDGRNIFVLEPCLDHKRLGEGESGPNTGGMGAICPGGITDERLLDQVQRQILVPTLDAIRREGLDYRGVLYAGIMLTPAGPKLLEYNARFGDPECQALMARFDADLMEVLLATGTRALDQVRIDWRPGASCCVVLASRGYPEKPRTGDVIGGLDEAARHEGVLVFHGATRRDAEGRIVTAGGRAISVVGVGDDPAQARQRAYDAAELIRWEHRVMRRDIGAVTAGASAAPA